MPTGQLYINNKDAFTQWGVSLNASGLSTLMTPPAVKSYIRNESAIENGSRLVTAVTPRLQSREFTVTVNLSAPDESTFLTRYASFVAEITSGELLIKTSFQPTVLYRCYYMSCDTFAEYQRGIGKFSLKLIEPDPSNRSLPVVNEN